ncbi:hypothetical protein ACO0LO_19020 [Undibacterium sp. TJN25]|uniref:hypothetical protein n=1 Tax=Undibacterium sp. TJN25 TaxID=3413056 RepID=UPI003BF3E370
MSSLVITAGAVRHRIEQWPVLSAGLAGMLIGMISAMIACLMLVAFDAFLPKELRGDSAAQHLGELSGGMMFFTAVLFVPAYETVLGQMLPVALVRRLGGGAMLCTVFSALFFGGMHYLNGGLVHGISATIIGPIFATSYLMFRSKGIWAGFICAFTTHATHNALLLYVLAAVMPEWA